MDSVSLSLPSPLVLSDSKYLTHSTQATLLHTPQRTEQFLCDEKDVVPG